MSLMGTLAKVAIGVAVAKGVGSMIQKSGGGSAGSGGTFGGKYSPGGSGGGLEDMMGEILGGKSTKTSGRTADTGGGSIFGGSGGGIGDFLEELGGKGQSGGTVTRGTQGGGLDDLLGGILGGGQGSAPSGGGLGDLLGGLLGGALGGAAGGASGRGGSFGDILNQSFGNRGEPSVQPTREQDAMAGLMLRAMIQAAKADGKVDADEQKKLLGNLGDISAAEKRFVEGELQAPVDVQGLARQVPKGLEAQVYTMSVMAIDLDNRNEAQYLHQLATAMGIDQRSVNQIHARLGVPALYA
ncbi:MAG: tellurite resistance TerB family protein [Rhodobacteraceae bacterium]|nr:tellurite resistance TerB family protein [Paracoccaceae bacterium]